MKVYEVPSKNRRSLQTAPSVAERLLLKSDLFSLVSPLRSRNKSLRNLGSISEIALDK